MKSIIRNIALPTGAAASERIMATSESNKTQRSFRFKKAHLATLLALIAPLQSFATTPTAPSESPYCIAVNGGWPSGGTTFVARNFTQPSESKCSVWTGYTLTASTVVLNTSGEACLSTDSTQLTVSVTSLDPEYLGGGSIVGDYIQLNRTSSSDPFSGQDYGHFPGSAEPTTCTSDLLTLPSSHN
jgi:hypothetical protein